MKVWVVGLPGSGKTWLAKRLARELGVPHVELDELFWGPSWQARSLSEFGGLAAEVARGDQWVIDGNYVKAAEILHLHADFLIWLDLPFWRTYPRVIARTLGRLVSAELLWNGNRETLANIFQKDGMPCYALLKHRRNQRRLAEYWRAFPGRRLRITGTRSAFADALRALHEVS